MNTECLGEGRELWSGALGSIGPASGRAKGENLFRRGPEQSPQRGESKDEGEEQVSQFRSPCLPVLWRDAGQIQKFDAV